METEGKVIAWVPSFGVVASNGVHETPASVDSERRTLPPMLEVQVMVREVPWAHCSPPLGAVRARKAGPMAMLALDASFTAGLSSQVTRMRPVAVEMFGTTRDWLPSLGVDGSRFPSVSNSAAALALAREFQVTPPSVERSIPTFSLLPRLLVQVTVWGAQAGPLFAAVGFGDGNKRSSDGEVVVTDGSDGSIGQPLDADAGYGGGVIGNGNYFGFVVRRGGGESHGERRAAVGGKPDADVVGGAEVGGPGDGLLSADAPLDRWPSWARSG